MKVEIYIEHTFKSPRRSQGIYGYILVYKTPDGKEATKTVIKELSATPHEADLTAAVEALGKLNRPCEVEIIAGSRYLRETVEAGWLDRWTGNGWKNAKGRSDCESKAVAAVRRDDAHASDHIRAGRKLPAVAPGRSRQKENRDERTR